MNTNSKLTTLVSPIKKSETNLHQAHRSLTLIQSPIQSDRPTRQHKQSIARIYVEQAWLYFQAQNWQKAIAACKNSLQLDPSNVEAFKILGNILKLQGKKAQALGVYAKALELNPNSAAIYANLGSFYAEQKNWQQALDYYQQAVILDPKLAGAYRSLAQVWEELGDTNRALECLCQAVNLEPEKLTSDEYFSFGQDLYQQGKIKEASIFYIHGVKQDPQAEFELAQLVQMLEELKEWQQAVIYYHQLISLTNNKIEGITATAQNKPIKNLLSRAKFDSAKSVNAQPTGKLLTQEQHNTPKLLSKVQVGNNIVHSQTGSPQEPDSAVSWNNLGSLYARKKQWAKAISCYQKAIELEPNLSKTYRNLARVYHLVSQDSKANLCWYQAFNLNSDRVKPEEYFALALKLLKQQELDKAIACLRQVIKLKPDSTQAYKILSKLYESKEKSA